MNHIIHEGKGVHLYTRRRNSILGVVRSTSRSELVGHVGGEERGQLTGGETGRRKSGLASKPPKRIKS